jgi:oligoendopeptidase F
MNMAGLPLRKDVPQEDCWQLEDMYASQDLWEQDFKECETLPEKMTASKGKISESAAMLKVAIEQMMTAYRSFEKVIVFASLRNAQDLGNSDSQRMMDRSSSLGTRISTALAWFEPELMAIDDAIMQEWLAGEELSEYRFWLEKILRHKPHVLSEKEEQILSLASEPLSASEKTFSMLDNVDLPARLPEIDDGEGGRVKLSHAGFIKLLEERNRDVRRDAFLKYYQEFKGNENTLAASLDGQMKTDVFYAKVRKHASAQEAALHSDNVPASVYESLLSAIHDSLPAFYRYMKLRREVLGYDKLHMYDIYVPIVPEVDMKFTWDEAVELTRKAVEPLGEEYRRIMDDGFANGWIDRYENQGKRSGAFSSGCYDSNPYILHNFTGTLDSVFTLAHEMGHSMHSWFSHHKQPYHLGDYKIFVAEVASITNEVLLTNHLLETLTEPSARAYVLNHYLESFRGTMFRQTMFAEYEHLIHAMVERNEPLTPQSLNEKYLELVKKYYGEEIAFDDEDKLIEVEWSRIPHFYYNFYVYKYATGMASSVKIAASILNEGEPALKRYLEFLSSGGSQYSLQQLQGAGVDLTDPTPIKDALAEFESRLTEFEQLMKTLR